MAKLEVREGVTGSGVSGEDVGGGKRRLSGSLWRCGGGEGNALSRYALAILKGGERELGGRQTLFRKVIITNENCIGLVKDSFVHLNVKSSWLPQTKNGE